MKKVVFSVVVVLLMMLPSASFAAGTYFCNSSAEKIFIVHATKNPSNQWVSQAWYTVEIDKCALLSIDSTAYYYAKTASNNQIWGYDTEATTKNFCVSDTVDPLVNADQACVSANHSLFNFRKVLPGVVGSVPNIILGDHNSLKKTTICNKFSEKITFSVGFENGKDFQTRGYWSIQPGVCNQVQVAFNSKNTYLRAKTDSGYWWNGQPSNAFVFCVSGGLPYEFPAAHSMTCAQPNIGSSFMRISNSQNFDFTAENATVRPGVQ